mgnify:CR=1 FL=1
MKKISFLSIMMLVLMAMPLFVSCGSDDDNDDGARDSQLVAEVSGTWMCVESTDTQQSGYELKSLIVGKEITIKKDGTFTSNAPSFGKSGTFTVSGNSITAKSEVGTFVVTVTVSGNKMTWDGTASNGVKFHYVFQRE